MIGKGKKLSSDSSKIWGYSFFEPPFPPIFGTPANALYKATGKRVYRQPFLGENKVMG
ncbi:MAG: hypothetical protein K9J37_22780 [Saprospiraceae bacterium]|nr:hypothetical protein [Saprospiraceae bacterium]MCF8252751.1 hypothetical protein [Saprospiraceae bacterium]MCF8283123.1 hypothetical protein [Bacteroidales bacterium]MCF8314313.1 hypothetical protein [Saprospiraceae bacterium]MCF8443178.1 hypothetical protein [Saprospiraceae bacterium]